MRFSALVVAAALAVPAAASSLACAVPNLPPDDSLADEQASTDPTVTKTTPPKKTAPSTGTGSTGTGSGSGGSTPPASTPSSTPDASAPAPTNTCSTAATQDACFRCCDVANPNAMPFLDNEWGKCQCEVPGACAGVCSSQYCAGQGVLQGGSCDNCLAANDSSCSTKAETKCAADATCKPYLTCTTVAGCASKPL